MMSRCREDLRERVRGFILRGLEGWARIPCLGDCDRCGSFFGRERRGRHFARSLVGLGSDVHEGSLRNCQVHLLQPSSSSPFPC